MTRVAAIDCGTNSLRLLIADVDAASGRLIDVDRRMEIVRLGEGVDRTHQIAPHALERTLAVARFYAALCVDARVEKVRFVATSATRDATNRGDFVAGVQQLFGVEPEVVPGEEEAALSFAGATRGLVGATPAGRASGSGDEPAGDAADGVLVVDIGGGSTEVVLGRTSVEAACSVDIGCVRLTERHLLDDPASPVQLAMARADVDSALDVVAAQVPLERAHSLVGLAGSVTTVTAHALGLTEYDPQLIHGAVLDTATVVAACQDLMTMPRAQRAELAYLHPGRVDVIAAGALIWQCVVQRVGAAAGITQAMTSEHDILDGIAWSLA